MSFIFGMLFGGLSVLVLHTLFEMLAQERERQREHKESKERKARNHG